MPGFENTFDPDFINRALANTTIASMYEENGVLCGFMGAHYTRNAIIHIIYVVPTLAKHGIGSMLLSNFFNWLPHDTHIKVLQNHSADFWMKFGFAREGATVSRPEGKRQIKQRTSVLCDLSLVLKKPSYRIGEKRV
jgi:GNAT superfamily N-acetyltransferase